MKDSLIREAGSEEVKLYYERREEHEDSRRVCRAPFLHVSHAHQHRGDRPAGRRLDRCGVESDLPSISDFISIQVLVGFEINDDPVLILLEGEVDDTLGKKSFIIAPHNRRFATAAVLLRCSARMM